MGSIGEFSLDVTQRLQAEAPLKLPKGNFLAELSIGDWSLKMRWKPWLTIICARISLGGPRAAKSISWLDEKEQERQHSSLNSGTKSGPMCGIILLI